MSFELLLSLVFLLLLLLFVDALTHCVTTPVVFMVMIYDTFGCDIV